jgi:hypothetical protein
MGTIEQIKQDQAACCNALITKQQTGAIQDVPSLQQNSPNPFSNTSIIRYYLPQSAPSAVINIQTGSGSVLQSFPISGPGNGQIMISAGALAAGTYYYNLVVNGNQVDIKKMVIVKD